MRIPVFLDDRAPDFEAARKAADEIAGQRMREPMLVAWYDGLAGIGHPDVHECTDKPGWLAYAESRGGDLAIDVNDGRYVMVYSETSPA
jgi:hypothetical protein